MLRSLYGTEGAAADSAASWNCPIAVGSVRLDLMLMLQLIFATQQIGTSTLLLLILTAGFTLLPLTRVFSSALASSSLFPRLAFFTAEAPVPLPRRPGGSGARRAFLLETLSFDGRVVLDWFYLGGSLLRSLASFGWL